MEAMLCLFIGLAVGALIVSLIKKNNVAKATQGLLTSLNQQKEQFAAEKSAMEQKLAVAQAQLESEKKSANERLLLEREHAEDIRKEQHRQHEAATKAIKEEVLNLANKMLADSKQQLTNDNKEKIESLLSPLRQQLDSFNRNVTASAKEGAANKTEIKTAFEDAMKKLHAEQEITIKSMKEMQEHTVSELKEQTERIGNDAASLTKALKGDSKMQGDWGEMILDKTLEDCGLEKDRQYFLQENYKDEDGNNFRPDAVIVFPNDERAVIDSKVSLTAYQEAVRADNQEDHDRLLKEHVASVRKHVDELSAKNYEKLVPGCIGYVLMFVPYESGYSAALKTDPGILQYAYRKHIIILSPSNLLMALQLTHTMWQNYRMNKNVEEILRQSNDLYDKFCGFAETFVKIGADIDRLRKDYDASHGQLSEGKGNVIRRLDNLKTLGISPKKQIPDSL